jgi:phage baseplate assembly protein W
MANYSDIDFALTPTEFNDFSLVTDNEAIKQSLRNVILTKRGARTRYQEPLFGTSINELLFEKANDITASLIRKEIKLAIENDENRVELLDVEVTARTLHNYEITITYRIVALQLEDSITFDIDILK